MPEQFDFDYNAAIATAMRQDSLDSTNASSPSSTDQTLFTPPSVLTPLQDLPKVKGESDCFLVGHAASGDIDTPSRPSNSDLFGLQMPWSIETRKQSDEYATVTAHDVLNDFNMEQMSFNHNIYQHNNTKSLPYKIMMTAPYNLSQQSPTSNKSSSPWSATACTETSLAGPDVSNSTDTVRRRTQSSSATIYTRQLFESQFDEYKNITPPPPLLLLSDSDDVDLFPLQFDHTISRHNVTLPLPSPPFNSPDLTSDDDDDSDYESPPIPNLLLDSENEDFYPHPPYRLNHQVKRSNNNFKARGYKEFWQDYRRKGDGLCVDSRLVKQELDDGPAFIESKELEGNQVYVMPEKEQLISAKTGRAKNACTNCHNRKMKCSVDLPSCANCSKRGLLCHYPAQVRRRGKARNSRGLTTDSMTPEPTCTILSSCNKRASSKGRRVSVRKRQKNA